MTDQSSTHSSKAAPLQRVDHLVFAAPDLDEGVREIRDRFGVEPVPGGHHPVYGTRNALVALGESSYLEIIAPDTKVLEHDEVHIFGIHGVDAPRLVTWAANGRNLQELADRSRKEMIDLGLVSQGSRHQPDGRELTWTATDPLAARNGGVLPFFVDWGDTEHPAKRLPAECELLEISLYHPHADDVQQRLKTIGLDMPVARAAEPRVGARIRTPNGVVEL